MPVVSLSEGRVDFTGIEATTASLRETCGVQIHFRSTRSLMCRSSCPGTWTSSRTLALSSHELVIVRCAQVDGSAGWSALVHPSLLSCLEAKVSLRGARGIATTCGREYYAGNKLPSSNSCSLPFRDRIQSQSSWHLQHFSLISRSVFCRESESYRFKSTTFKVSDCYEPSRYSLISELSK